MLGATNDSVTGGLRAQGPGFDASPAPKRLAMVSDLGHHFCSDLCWIGEDQGGIVGRDESRELQSMKLELQRMKKEVSPHECVRPARVVAVAPTSTHHPPLSQTAEAF